LKDASRPRTDRYSGSWAALWWLLALAYPVLLIVAASRPEFGAEFTRMLIGRLMPGLASRHVHMLVVAIRKSGHFLGYSLFATILANAFLSLSRPPRSRKSLAIACVAAAIVAVGVAAMDEHIQLTAAFRSGSRQDVLVDSLGVLTALVFRIRRVE
jgi:VanZ family protein